MSIFIALLPAIFSVVKWILGKNKANEETMKAFLDLIEKAKLDPSICLKMKDDVKSMKDELAGGGGN